MTIELNSFQTKIPNSCNFTTIVALSTFPCHQQKLRHASRGLHKINIIKSNFIVFNSVINVVCTNHVCL